MNGNVFPPQGAGGGPLSINIKVEDLAPIVCPGVIKQTLKLCESTIFILAYELRVAPALMTGAGQDTVIQVPVYICTTCKAVIRTAEENAAIKAAARRSSRKAAGEPE